MRWLAAISTCTLVLCATGVHAQAAISGDPGTHFLAELEGGVLLSGDAGPAMRASLGVGAKWKGFPARFYAIGQFGASSYVASPPRELAAGGGRESGAFQDLALGLRVVLPIVSELRVYVEGLGGGTLASARFQEPGLGTLHAREWLGLALLSGGLQYRIFYQLSVGARLSVAFNPTALAGVARYAGVHDGGRLMLTGGVTWHF